MKPGWSRGSCKVYCDRPPVKCMASFRPWVWLVRPCGVGTLNDGPPGGPQGGLGAGSCAGRGGRTGRESAGAAGPPQRRSARLGGPAERWEGRKLSDTEADGGGGRREGRGDSLVVFIIINGVLLLRLRGLVILGGDRWFLYVLGGGGPGRVSIWSFHGCLSTGSACIRRCRMKQGAGEGVDFKLRLPAARSIHVRRERHGVPSASWHGVHSALVAADGQPMSAGAADDSQRKRNAKCACCGRVRTRGRTHTHTGRAAAVLLRCCWRVCGTQMRPPQDGLRWTPTLTSQHGNTVGREPPFRSALGSK